MPNIVPPHKSGTFYDADVDHSDSFGDYDSEAPSTADYSDTYSATSSTEETFTTLVWTTVWVDGTRTTEADIALLLTQRALTDTLRDDTLCEHGPENIPRNPGWADDAFWHLIKIHTTTPLDYLLDIIRERNPFVLPRATIALCPFPEITLTRIPYESIRNLLKQNPWKGIIAISLMDNGRPFSWEEETIFDIMRSIIYNEENIPPNEIA